MTDDGYKCEWCGKTHGLWFEASVCCLKQGEGAVDRLEKLKAETGTRTPRVNRPRAKVSERSEYWRARYLARKEG